MFASIQVNKCISILLLSHCVKTMFDNNTNAIIDNTYTITAVTHEQQLPVSVLVVDSLAAVRHKTGLSQRLSTGLQGQQVM